MLVDHAGGGRGLNTLMLTALLVGGSIVLLGGGWRTARRALLKLVPHEGFAGRIFPPEVADRIFSPFFTTKPQGSGLGLAIVRKIIDAHDGRIDIGGRQGGGTTFRVTLPVKSQQGLFG